MSVAFFFKGKPGIFLHPFPCGLTVTGIIKIPAADDYNLAVSGQLPGNVHGVQGGEELTECKVPGAAEYGKVGVNYHLLSSIHGGMCLPGPSFHTCGRRSSRAVPGSGWLPLLFRKTHPDRRWHCRAPGWVARS